MAIRIGFLTLTDRNDGEIVGPSVSRPGTIEILEMKHQVAHDFDPVHGRASGDRKHQPMLLTKEVDLVTPLLCALCMSGETMNAAKLDYYVQTGETRNDVPFFSWTLFDVAVVSVRCIPATEIAEEFSDRYDLLEEVGFTYQRIEWLHHAHLHLGQLDLDQVIEEDGWAEVGA